jgi:hypothetical protein
VAPVAAAPARATPRSTGRRMESRQKQVQPSIIWFSTEQLHSQEVCPGPGLGKLRHNLPRITSMDPALAGKVSSVGRLGSFY